MLYGTLLQIRLQEKFTTQIQRGILLSCYRLLLQKVRERRFPQVYHVYRRIGIKSGEISLLKTQ